MPRRPLLGCLLAALLLSLPAWAGRRTLRYQLPQDVLESFAFETTRRVATRVVSLPPEADAYDVDSVLDRMRSVQTRTTGRVERVVARVHRDGSLGLVSRLVGLQGSIDRGTGPTALDVAVLEGKSLSMRVLPSGELLDSFGWTHFAGAGRGADLVGELFTQTVLRLPYAVPKGGSIPTTFRVRLPLDPLVQRDQNWNLAYTDGEPPADCKGKCVALAYTGTVTELSRDTHPARRMELQGEAKVQGTILLAGNRRLREHRWSITWARELSSQRADGALRGALVQDVVIEGSVVAEGP